ncbi:thioredoxin family protein, partial [Streptomyces sp. NPDC058171]
MPRVQPVTDELFTDAVLASDLPVLVAFVATRCEPSARMLAPLDELADRYTGRLKVVTSDVGENPRTTHTYAIRATPTFLMFVGAESMEDDRVVGSCERPLIYVVDRRLRLLEEPDEEPEIPPSRPSTEPHRIGNTSWSPVASSSTPTAAAKPDNPAANDAADRRPATSRTSHYQELAAMLRGPYRMLQSVVAAPLRTQNELEQALGDPRVRAAALVALTATVGERAV